LVLTKGPHFFVHARDLCGDVAVLRGEDARHLTVVLRAMPGEAVSLSDGAGRCWQTSVLAAKENRVELRLEQELLMERPRPWVRVVHALPKGRKLDEVVQRLVEIGVDRVVPVHSMRSAVRLSPSKSAKVVARWRAIALAAAKQSRRIWLPEISEVGEWVAAFGDAKSGVCCWEEATQPLHHSLPDVGSPAEAEEIVLAIGPEGGLTPAEVAATGLEPVSLGSTIMRTETAALVAATIVLHRLGRLG
jgi:16S rRNA (uracil1498-N3)-methyltransferase